MPTRGDGPHGLVADQVLHGHSLDFSGHAPVQTEGRERLHGFPEHEIGISVHQIRTENLKKHQQKEVVPDAGQPTCQKRQAEGTPEGQTAFFPAHRQQHHHHDRHDDHQYVGCRPIAQQPIELNQVGHDVACHDEQATGEGMAPQRGRNGRVRSALGGTGLFEVFRIRDVGHGIE